MITPAQRAEIRRLFYGEHWKVGTIAAQLGIHHETVRAAVERETAGVRPSLCRPSILDPYLPFIRDTLAQYPNLRATRIYEMVRQRGYPGSVIQVRRLARRLRPETNRTVYRRVVTLPGESYVESRVMLSETDQERFLADRGRLALPIIPTGTRAIRVGHWRAGEVLARPGLGCRHGPRRPVSSRGRSGRSACSPMSSPLANGWTGSTDRLGPRRARAGPGRVGDRHLQDRVDRPSFLGRQARPSSLITLRLAHPVSQRLRRTADLLGHRTNRRALRVVLVLLLEHQPHRPLSNLWRVTPDMLHGPIFPRIRASETPGRFSSGSVYGVYGAAVSPPAVP